MAEGHGQIQLQAREGQAGDIVETVIDKIKAHLLFTPPPVIAFPNWEGEWGWSLSMEEMT